MYHRVLPREEISRSLSHPGIIVSSRAFERQMRWLGRHLDMITPDRLIEHLRSGKPFKTGIGLATFDDGWRDNYLHALPIARRHGVPFTVFLPVAYVGTRRRFWQERTVHLVRQIRARYEGIRSMPSGAPSTAVMKGLQPCLESGRERSDAAIGRFVAAMKEAGPEAVGRTLDELSAIAGVDRDTGDDEPDFLDWDQVSEMKACGVSFGSHGMSHQILTRAGTDLNAELQGSKAVLEEKLGHEVRALAYPNGDFNEAVVKGAREAGFEVAFSTRRGYVSRDQDRFALSRINIHDHMTDTLPMFLARLVGLW
jgi:peptidoglycan/xylan/chitin deacetylase (PgdA/CDA1 family)